MVLEETLVFGEAGDADRFVTFLKGQGVRARRRVMSFITEETQVRGPISGLFDWLNAEIEERKLDEEPPDAFEEGLKEGDDEGFEADRFGDPATMSERRQLELIRDTLIRQYVMLSQALNGKVIGDPVAVDKPLRDGDLPELRMTNGGLLNLLGELDEALVRHTLIETGVVEESDEGLRLIRMVVPDEIEIEIAVSDIDVTPELVDEHGVRTEFLFHFETEYSVECEGTIHLACTPDEVEQAVLGTSVTPESLDDLIYSTQMKAQVIGAVLEVFDREGRTTLETVVGALRGARIETNSSAVIMLDTTPEFVRALVEDLRKAGAITGNDRKLRRT